MRDELEIHTDPDTGVRYLDPVQYQPLTIGKRTIGWQLTNQAERDRWDNPPKTSQPATRPAEQPRPLQALIVELETWIDLTPPLETQLRAAYATDALRVSRLSNNIIRSAEQNMLKNPAGLLVTRLREIK